MESFERSTGLYAWSFDHGSEDGSTVRRCSNEHGPVPPDYREPELKLSYPFVCSAPSGLG